MINSEKKYERVFSVGCFDQFHYGHKKILNSMREFGKELIVGIHDDDSIEKLKNLPKNAHKTLKDRLKDLKPYCDRIFIINSTDPTDALVGIISDSDNKENAVFIRGADNQTFPGKHFVETKINIHYLPYTESISATKIRKDLGLI
jgi:cytidyltransferase-like protein